MYKDTDPQETREWLESIEDALEAYEPRVKLLDVRVTDNIDGNVDVLDVVQVVNFIIGNSAPDDAQGCAADMNEDVNIYVLYVVQMVNKIINI